MQDVSKCGHCTEQSQNELSIPNPISKYPQLLYKYQ